MLRDFTKETYDIIVQGGQSNAEGCGCGDTEHPYVANDDVHYLNNDFSISVAQERIWGNYIASDFALSFAREYRRSKRLPSDRKLLIVRSAVGGTGFLDNRWKLTDDLYLRMVEMTQTALALNPDNRLVAFLWHQGETDAILNADYRTHYDHLHTLISTFRATINCPDLPFIAGDFTQEWEGENLQACEPVVRAIRDVCAGIGHGAFVETDGLESNMHRTGFDHIIHFCREALYELGVRYFHAFEELTDK